MKRYWRSFLISARPTEEVSQNKLNGGAQRRIGGHRRSAAVDSDRRGDYAELRCCERVDKWGLSFGSKCHRYKKGRSDFINRTFL